MLNACLWSNYIYIYIYAFSRRFYPKRLTVHSGYTFVLSVIVHNLAVHIITNRSIY